MAIYTPILYFSYNRKWSSWSAGHVQCDHVQCMISSAACRGGGADPSIKPWQGPWPDCPPPPGSAKVSFKNKLDTNFWGYQDLICDYTSELTETGNRSLINNLEW